MIARDALFFGPSERRLVGWYHRAPDLAHELTVIVCPPIGHEYINSHRTIRHLADALAAAGVHALRVDYDGTGDSAGDDDDPGRVDAWLASVRALISLVRERTPGVRVGLAGLRFGATLAALVAADAGLDIDCLVAWAPCPRGRAYVRELKALHLTGDNRHLVVDDDHMEPGGFVMTAETQAAIGAIDLSRVIPLARRTCLAHRAGADEKLLSAWRAASVPLTELSVDGLDEVFLPPHNTVVPQAAIARIVRWTTMDSSAPQSSRVERHLAGSRTARIQFNGTELDETIVHIDAGPGGRLVGILSEQGAGDQPLVLLPNAGATHHVGPNRLYVALGRAIATAGARCLRFDLTGLGDSIAPDGVRENDPYPEFAAEQVAMVAAAMRALRPTTGLLVMGLCSGAHAAFHAALDVSGFDVDECVLINPLTFYYRAGMSLDQSASNHHEDWQRCARNIGSIRGWSKLFNDDVDIRSVARSVVSRARDVARNRARALRHTLGFASGQPLDGDDALDADLRRLAANDRRLTFVFSRYDPGYDLLNVHGGRAVKRLSRSGHLRLFQVDGANHTFEARASRRELLELVARQIVAPHTRAPAAGSGLSGAG